MIIENGKEAFAIFSEASKMQALRAFPTNAVQVTAKQYRDSVLSNRNDETGKAIDAGKEPHLISKGLAEMGMYALQPIHDLYTECEDESGNIIDGVKLELMRGPVIVSDSHLVVLL
jgi:hypothetical protein